MTETFMHFTLLTGGRTTGHITACIRVDDDKGKAAIAFCSPKDRFIKSCGRNIAKGRLDKSESITAKKATLYYPDGVQDCFCITSTKCEAQSDKRSLGVLNFTIPKGKHFRDQFKKELYNYISTSKEFVPRWAKRGSKGIFNDWYTR